MRLFKYLGGLVAGLTLGALIGTAIAGRDSAGNYTLPSGNPVVTGTTISSTWANNTLSDLSTEVTDSLDRSGKGGMLSPLRCTNGSLTAPSMSFTSETNAGLFRNGSHDIQMSVNGVEAMQWTNTGTLIPLGLTVNQSNSNLQALSCTGNGTGAGVICVGGATSGGGGGFTGGAPNGLGVMGTGTGTGAGVNGAGGNASVAGTGVLGTGGISSVTTAGNGGKFVGGAGSAGATNGIGVLGLGTGATAPTGGQIAGIGVYGIGTTNYSGGVFVAGGGTLPSSAGAALVAVGPGSSSDIFQALNASAVQVASVRTDGSLHLTGVATGSLLTCASGEKGTVQFDTTVNALKYCDGTTWQQPTYTGQRPIYWGGYAANTAGGTQWKTKTINAGTLNNCTFTTQVIGNTCTSNVISVEDADNANTIVCSVTLNGVGTVGTSVENTSCSSGTYPAAHHLFATWSTNNCTTTPVGNFFCMANE